MPLKSLPFIPFLDGKLKLPFCFNIPLPFSKEDKSEFPWLSQKDRYYGIETALDKGGRAITYLGFISDKMGNSIAKYEDRKIVLKLPNIDQSEYTSENIKAYLSNQNNAALDEWGLKSARLRGCKFANPIFDMQSIPMSYMSGLIFIPVTAQRFLSELTLYKYLFANNSQEPPEGWRGIQSESQLIELARCIAIGLADIHQRRVTHGDIWPPNIFIRKVDGKPQVVFIDFGESFQAELQDAKPMKDNVYRAPEREDHKCNIVTNPIDVYAYGKLLLHLAIGQQILIPREKKGYDRRDFIKNIFAQNNPEITNKNPYIIDLICNCVSFDPVDRPNISDVLRALDSYVDQKIVINHTPNVLEKISTLHNFWKKKYKAIDPFLEELIEQKLYELEELTKNLSNEVVILNDTREHLIVALISLFQKLNINDRFISITTPSMWQSSALGLDGRYFTASELAAVRKASVQRTFVFSIEEVGEEWAENLAEKLEHINTTTSNHSLLKLATDIREKVEDFKKLPKSGLSNKIKKIMGERITLIIKSYLEASKTTCKDLFDKSEFVSFEDCKGIYLGLLPVATIKDIQIIKVANPYSIFFYNEAKKEEDKYLLMMTDCHARNFYDNGKILRPELKGMWVFKSSLGVPRDRIKKIEQVFKNSTNIAPWLDPFYTSLTEINKEIISGK